MRHPCRTLLCDTLVGHSCRTLLWDTLVAYSCRTLLSDTLVGHPCRTLLWGTTTKVFNCKPSRFQNEFERDLLQKSHVKSAKGAFHTRLLPKQNKRFARDFLKNSHLKSAKRAFRTRQFQKSRVKSPKRAFRTKLPPQKSSGKPMGAHTSSSPAKQFCDSSSSKQHPLTRQSQCHRDIHETLRVHWRPHLQSTAPATKCDLLHTSQPHDSLRLPRKVTISYHVSFSKICTTSHVWNDFDRF